jgi:MscS family membrane protein
MDHVIAAPLLASLLLALSQATPAAPPVAEVTAAPRVAPPEGPAGGDGAASPRELVERFLDLTHDGRFREAASLLDLAPAQRPDGEALARQLKAVLDRSLRIDLQAVSDAPEGRPGDGLPAGLDELGRVPGAAGQLEPVRLVRLDEGEARTWRFARSTVERIPTWYGRLPGRWALDRLPAPLLRAGPMDLPWWQWLVLLVVAPVAWALGAILGRISRAVLLRIARRTGSTWDDDLASRMGGPLTLAWSLAVAGLLLARLDMARPIQLATDRALRTGLLVVVFWSLLRAIDVSTGALSRAPWALERPGSRSLLSITGRIAKVVVAALAVVAALSELGYPVGSLLAGLGLGGLAFALAAQKTVENLFGALSLGLDQPIREGDFIKVEELVGTVEAIGLRSTRIRTLDRTLVSIPNGRLADMRLESFAARDRIRLACDLGLVYETSAEQVREVLAGLEAVLRGHPLIWPDTVVVRLKQFGAFSLDIEVMAWFRTADWGQFQAIRQEVLLQFMGVVRAAGTAMAFPTQTLHLTPRDARGLAASPDRGRP